MIVCAGAHAAVVADILQRPHDAGAPIQLLGFVDDTPGLQGTSILGLDVLAPIASLGAINHDAVIVAAGDNHTRRLLTERLVSAGEQLVTAIHPHASVAPSATIGEGSMICAGAIVAPRAVIGRGVIVNTKASVDHDSIVEDFAHVSSGATVGGRVFIGTETLIAIGASVASSKRVGARTTIGSGAAVVSDIPDDVVAFGVPARVRPDRKR